MGGNEEIKFNFQTPATKREFKGLYNKTKAPFLGAFFLLRCRRPSPRDNIFARSHVRAGLRRCTVCLPKAKIYCPPFEGGIKGGCLRITKKLEYCETDEALISIFVCINTPPFPPLAGEARIDRA